MTELASLGSFFAVDVHQLEDRPDPPWRSVYSFLDSSGQLTERINNVQQSLALRAGRRPEQIDRRVAASIAQLGLVSRIVAPAIGAATLGAPLDSRCGNWWWKDELGGPFPVSATPARIITADSSALLTNFVGPLIAAVQKIVPMSARVLWGNVASAVNTAGTLIADIRPDLATRAHSETAAWRQDRRLNAEDGAQGPTFRRASCCLAYRLAQTRADAVCGDCVLAAG